MLVSAVYENGVALCQDQLVLADSRLLETASSAFCVLEVRMVIPARQSEELFEAMVRGQVELLIQDAPARSER